MAIDLGDQNVLCRFDKLAAMGIVHYAESSIVPVVDQEFPVRVDMALLRNDTFNDTQISLSFASAHPGPRSL